MSPGSRVPSDVIPPPFTSSTTQPFADRSCMMRRPSCIVNRLTVSLICPTSSLRCATIQTRRSDSSARRHLDKHGTVVLPRIDDTPLYVLLVTTKHVSPKSHSKWNFERWNNKGVTTAQCRCTRRPLGRLSSPSRIYACHNQHVPTACLPRLSVSRQGRQRRPRGNNLY